MNPLYSQFSLALMTDLYELTMAYGYWKQGMAEVESVFHLFYRRPPFNGGYAVAAGLQSVIAHLKNYRFDSSDLEYLSSLDLFEKGFLDYLKNLQFTCDIDGVCEGEIVFPFEPLLRVKGPILQAQLLESSLLTLINFPSLIATKAARVCYAARGDEVIEFGLRRAQGIDGAMTATRSAFIGGCTATSNTLGGKVWGIPVRGTHAHSWVMAFESELESFQSYAHAMPNNSVFLVDTYDTIQGVKNAIVAGQWLRDNNKKLLGIRLDSGDLAALSIEARKLLDDAGFKDAVILASNELNEFLIADLKNQGAKIGVWGVGTHLVTGYSQPALDGVYKLSAIKKGDEWEYKLKLSEQMTKVSNPGILQIKRYFDEKQGYIADAIYDINTDISDGCTIVDPFDRTKQRILSSSHASRDVLQPIFRGGKCIYKEPTLLEIQSYAREELNKFDRSIKRFFNPHLYPVGMEIGLYDVKIKLIEKIRNS